MKKLGAKAHGYERVALACQGGGSLGAYHIGAYQAMDEAGYQPDVVSGISIGAFTAALIAGNEPENRISALKNFWQTISYPDFGDNLRLTPELRKTHNLLSSMQGFIFGQPNFFEPRSPAPQFQKSGTPEATSYYDTAPLRETLLKFVDFDRINNKKTRLLLGAVKVTSGELVFFDSAHQKIAPEHVMASGAMPPGFPGVRIDNELYWDGGCVSNTPLEGIFNMTPSIDTLTFMVDLFNPKGEEPKNMDDVSSRSRDIMYTSRTAHHIEHIADKHTLKKALHHLMSNLPKDLGKDPIVKELQKLSQDINFDIVHVVYDAPAYEVSSKDCEFSRTSINDRAEHGYLDVQNAIKASPWLKQKQHPSLGCQVHRFSSVGKRKA